VCGQASLKPLSCPSTRSISGSGSGSTSRPLPLSISRAAASPVSGSSTGSDALSPFSIISRSFSPSTSRCSAAADGGAAMDRRCAATIDCRSPMMLVCPGARNSRSPGRPDSAPSIIITSPVSSIDRWMPSTSRSRRSRAARSAALALADASYAHACFFRRSALSSCRIDANEALSSDV